MIQEVIISGFQSHQYTNLILSEGVNTLIGDTGSGKSAVFRALIWLFTNRPLGVESFWSWWEGNIHVAVKADDIWLGRKVILHRTKKGKVEKDDDYYYIDEDIEKNRLRAFGNGPPPEQVTKVLNLQEVNFQPQMSLPFLLSQSSGKVSKFLNDAADLDIIGKSESNIASTLRKEEGQLKSAKANKKQLKQNLEDFDWIDNAETELIELENIEDEISNLSAGIDLLDNLLNNIDVIEEEIEKMEPILKAKDKIDELILLSEEIEELDGKINSLDNLLNDIDDTEADITEASRFLVAKDSVYKLIALSNEIANLESREAVLGNWLSQLTDIHYRIDKEQQELDIMEARFHEIFPEKCPLCEK